MDQASLGIKVKSVMARVFQVAESAIDDHSSQQSIAKWDSMGHMNLVVALEEEFGVEFKDDQAMKLLSFAQIMTTLMEALADRSS